MMLQHQKIRCTKCSPFAGEAEFPPFKKLPDPRKFCRYTAW